MGGPPATVLIHEFVTGGGLSGEDLPPSWAAEGRAMRLALAEDFSALVGLDVTMTRDARLPHEDGPWRTIAVGPGEEHGVFLRLSAEHDFTLCVAPETNGVLEQRARWIESAGGRSLGSSPEAIALCADKIRTGRHLCSLGIRSPESLVVMPRDGLPHDFAYPAVLKPIDGAGSMTTFFLESPDDLPAEALSMDRAMLQTFVPGRPMSASFLIGPGGEPLLIGLADQHVDRDGGRFRYRGGRIRPEADVDIGALMATARSVPGLIGWIGVDFLRDDVTGAITILEINPRVTTSYVGFRRSLNGRGPRPWIARRWLGGEQDVSRRVGLAQLFMPERWPEPARRGAPNLIRVSFSADGTILDGGTER